MSSIRFARPASAWLECLPLGDGRLGVMTDGGVASTTLHLNDGTAWSGSPASELAGGAPDADECAALLGEARAAIAAGDPIAAEAPLQRMQTRYSQAYVPLGSARIVTDATTPGPYARLLDLHTGVHSAHDGDRQTQSFVSAAHHVLVHVITPAVDARVELESPLGRLGDIVDGDTAALLLRLPDDVAPGHEPDLPAAVYSDEPGSALEAAIASRVVRHADHTLVLVAGVTTYSHLGAAPVGTAQDAWAEAVARIDAAAAEGAGRLFATHEAATRALLGATRLTIGADAADRPTADDRDTGARLDAALADPRGVLAADPGLVTLLFDYGRYLLASTSRPGGLPATLQGLWNAEMRPPWSSNYTLNINTEMNYWGAHATQLSDCADPLTEFTLALADRAAASTARLYGAPGWTAHHNSDAWLYSTPAGRGTGDPRWAHWPLAGAWLGRMLVEPWDAGAAGRAHLERIWPALRGAAEFALAWIAPDGSTSPASSPENAYLTPEGRVATLARASAMDTSLLRGLLVDVVRVAGELGVDDPLVVAARERVAALPEGPGVTPDGALVEWEAQHPYEDPHHRHVSHLYGLYPGDEDWGADRRAAAARTLEARGDDSSGWSLVWKTALWARLGRGDRVSQLLPLFLRRATDSGPWSAGLYPNLFAAHPPFQIDGNLGFVGAFVQCLLQDRTGIELLPALPAELGEGRVTGLVARPGVVVDLEWSGGALVRANLQARTPRAAGDHLVGWQGRRITVAIAHGAATVLTPESFG